MLLLALPVVLAMAYSRAGGAGDGDGTTAAASAVILKVSSAAQDGAARRHPGAGAVIAVYKR
jgi:hypothetical protein